MHKHICAWDSWKAHRYNIFITYTHGTYTYIHTYACISTYKLGFQEKLVATNIYTHIHMAHIHTYLPIYYIHTGFREDLRSLVLIYTYIHIHTHAHTRQVREELADTRAERAEKLTFDALTNHWTKCSVNLRVAKSSFAFGQQHDCVFVNDDEDVYSGEFLGHSDPYVLKKAHGFDELS